MIEKLITLPHSFINRKTNWIAFWTLTLLFIYFYQKGFILSSDSQSYINKELIRSPLYPLLIQSLSFFNSSYNLLVIFQLAFGFFSCFSMVKTLQKYFSFGGATFLFLLLIHLSPYFFYYGNHVLSEGLAYPLFLWSALFLIKSLYTRQAKYVLFFIVSLTLLVLTRKQYVFLYVVGFVVITYFLWQKLINYKKMLILITVLGFSFLSTNLLEKMYHKHYNDKFITVPFLGIQLVVMPMYLSSKEDVALFTDPIEANIFRDAIEMVDKEKYGASSLWKPEEHPEYHHYYMNYNNVCWKAISSSLAKNCKPFDWVSIDVTLTKMSFILIKQHWKRYVSLYLRSIIHGLGGYYLFSFILFGFLLSAYCHHQNKDKLSLIVFMSILITYGNYFLVALVEPAMTRYTFSTNILLISILSIVLLHSLKFFGQHEKTI